MTELQLETRVENQDQNFRDDINDEERDCKIINIHRYKFTQVFMDELYEFSKIHQFDDRKLFKESWTIWVEESDSLIQNETERMKNLGYDGDVLDKMFKSARYYFRKKSSVKPEPKERRKYISVKRELLEEMDSHIISGINNKNKYKPSEGFDDFCQKNTETLKKEIETLIEKNIESTEIIAKIKKTYKNRYFMLTNK
uniref:Uncharacterized protein n=1 Tax=viral metagenome TaxID=1070528 RepID=A0A6C0D9D3_9ZZZZ